MTWHCLEKATRWKPKERLLLEIDDMIISFTCLVREDEELEFMMLYEGWTGK